MPRDFSRPRRVGEQIQRELAVLIQQEIKDPRLGMVTLSGVEVSRDLSLAKVFITVLDGEADVAQSLEVLQGASGFLRHCLGQAMTLRSVPELRFLHDESIQRGNRLASLIDSAVAADRERQETADDEAES